MATALIQQDLWSPDLVADGSSSVEPELAYLRAVEELRQAIRAAKDRRPLLVNAVRAAVAAGITQDRMRHDLGLSRPRASELHRAIALENELIVSGILPATEVTVSHLEALLPVPDADRPALVMQVIADRLSVSALRRVLGDHGEARADQGHEVDAIRAHLGKYLRPGWESVVPELLQRVLQLAADVPMGTSRREAG